MYFRRLTHRCQSKRTTLRQCERHVITLHVHVAGICFTLAPLTQPQDLRIERIHHTALGILFQPHLDATTPPAFAVNGSLVLVCGSKHIYRTDGDPMEKEGWISLTEVDESAWTDGRYLKVEDAFLWQDSEENWHLLTHRYDYRDGYPPNPNQTNPVLVAGHAYSRDLFQWHLSAEPPFDSSITFVGGKTQNFATMERPHLVFTDRIPTHIIHGVSPIWDQYGAPCNVCDARPGSAHSCVVCKTSAGYDWTYTLVQRLRATQSVDVTV